MRRIAWLAALLVLAMAFVLAGCGGDPAVDGPGDGDDVQPQVAPGPARISLTSGGFDPPEVTVGAEDPVTFVNADDVAHTLTIIFLGIPLEEDVVLQPGEEYERSFQATGEYEVVMDDDEELRGELNVR